LFREGLAFTRWLLLGHKDISTTERYAHHFPESLRDRAEILESEHEGRGETSGRLSQFFNQWSAPLNDSMEDKICRKSLLR
jgi:hypothetical protein